MPGKRIASRHTDAVLTALQCQGKSNNCGPFTTATVLNAVLGRNFSGAKLAALMNRPVLRGRRLVVRRIPNWATFPWGMVDVMREQGLDAHWRFLASREYLIKGLDQGWLLMPIIGTWRPLWAHVMTLLMWDAEKGWGFANTGVNQRSMYWLEEQDFLTKWRAMGRLLVVVKDVQTLKHKPEGLGGMTGKESGGKDEF
jgi:hypothetical protein